MYIVIFHVAVLWMFECMYLSHKHLSEHYQNLGILSIFNLLCFVWCFDANEQPNVLFGDDFMVRFNIKQTFMTVICFKNIWGLFSILVLKKYITCVVPAKGQHRLVLFLFFLIQSMFINKTICNLFFFPGRIQFCCPQKTYLTS